MLGHCRTLRGGGSSRVRDAGLKGDTERGACRCRLAGDERRSCIAKAPAIKSRAFTGKSLEG